MPTWLHSERQAIQGYICQNYIFKKTKEKQGKEKSTTGSDSRPEAIRNYDKRKGKLSSLKKIKYAAFSHS